MLTYLVNESFLSGEFSDCLNESLVTPVYKSGSPETSSNCRSIFVSPLIGKFLEKCISVRVTSFFINILFFRNANLAFRPENPAVMQFHL